MNEDAPSPDPNVVFETSDDKFELDVFERSRLMPVIVDFWASWCAPCRQLTPILEKVTAEFAGRLALVKANTEEAPQAAGQFNVQSIPFVVAVIDGEPIDYFAGAMPEEQIRQWMQRIVDTHSFSQAQSLEESEPQKAAQVYREAIEKNPEHFEAHIGLARVALVEGKRDEAAEIIATLEKRGFLEPEAEKVKAALELEEGGGNDDFESHCQAAEADPDNLDLRLDHARALAGRREFEPALEKALSIIEMQKDGVGDEARKLMLDIFQVLPQDSELTRNYRRQLSMLLF